MIFEVGDKLTPQQAFDYTTKHIADLQDQINQIAKLVVILSRRVNELEGKNTIHEGTP